MVEAKVEDGACATEKANATASAGGPSLRVSPVTPNPRCLLATWPADESTPQEHRHAHPCQVDAHAGFVVPMAEAIDGPYATEKANGAHSAMALHCD